VNDATAHAGTAIDAYRLRGIAPGVDTVTSRSPQNLTQLVEAFAVSRGSQSDLAAEQAVARVAPAA